MGDRAGRHRARVLMGIRERKLMPDTYVITLPQSGNHILDIRPVMLLTEEERKAEDFLILGVAEGYGEACEVVRTMVDDMYRHTDGFNWKSYMAYLGRQNDSYSACDIEDNRYCSSGHPGAAAWHSPGSAVHPL